MKHIFYIHSNICSIVVYDSIVQLLNSGDDVIVVTSRNAKWKYLLDKVKVYDLSDIHDEYLKNKSKHNDNAFYRLWNYETKQRSVLYGFCKKIINKEEFIFYVPHYALIYAKPFLTSKYMKAYYYLEEGVLSYSPLQYLKDKYYYPTKYSLHGFLYYLFGINYGFMLKKGDRFKGTIAISKKAFLWNDQERIVNSFESYVNSTSNNVNAYDAILVSSSINNKIELNKAVIKESAIYICNKKPGARIGIKFHPSAYSYEKEQCDVISQYIENELTQYNISILPIDFVIEKEIFSNKAEVYSLLALSSLSLYSVQFADRAYYFKCEGVDNKITLVEIQSYEEYFKIINVPLAD